MTNKEVMKEQVNNPAHYEGLPCCGQAPIKLLQAFKFNAGNCIKYIIRAGKKDDEIQDLRKAIKYLEFEIERITEERAKTDL